jgi:hypothetical protein
MNEPNLAEQFVEAHSRYGTGYTDELPVPFRMYAALDGQNLLDYVMPDKRVGFGRQRGKHALLLSTRVLVSPMLPRDSTMEQLVIRALWAEDKLR